MDEYALASPQETGDADVTGHASLSWPRWMDLPVQGTIQRLLVVVAGETFRTPMLTVSSPEHRLEWSVRVIPEQISRDGLEVRIAFVARDRAPVELLRVSLANPSCPQRRFAGELSLAEFSGLHGRIELHCAAGPENISDGDWLGVESLVVAHRERLSLMQARTHHQFRLSNEIRHFPQAYAQSFYSRRDPGGEAAITPLAPRDAQASRPPPASRAEGDRQRQLLADLVDIDVEPDGDEDAFSYLHRLMQAYMPAPAPDFAGRLRAIAPQREPLQVLSLLTGAGRVEKSLARAAGRRMSMTFIDANAELLESASAGLPPHVESVARVSDVNALDASAATFDVAICVSGLHHVVELEQLLRSVRSCLREDGEFWVVGEQVGRNGNRLWHSARRAADALFAELPDELRRNAASGRTDRTLPDIDHSLSMFEGIRSQEIEGLLADLFEPVQVFRFNCFAWMFVDHRYRGNYDLKTQAHRRWLRRIAAEDLSHWLDGGRACEMHGVFRPRRIRRPAGGASQP